MSYNKYFKSNDSTSLEELIKIIKENNEKALAIRQELNVLSKSTAPKKDSASNEISSNNAFVKAENISESSNLIELYKAISTLNIKGQDEDEIIERIKQILACIPITPTLINKLKILLYKEYIFYSKLLLNVTSENEASKIESTLLEISTKMSLLDELEQEKEFNESLTPNNNLFFLETASGNVIALESLRKNIPREYYPMFKELLLSLKGGKKVCIKCLGNRGYYELKRFEIRIIFAKLSNGNFLIIDTFMKKTQKDAYYRSRLNIRTKEYYTNRGKYLNNLGIAEFIKLHESYLAEILSVLDSKSLEEGSPNEARNI